MSKVELIKALEPFRPGTVHKTTHAGEKLISLEQLRALSNAYTLARQLNEPQGCDCMDGAYDHCPACSPPLNPGWLKRQADAIAQPAPQPNAEVAERMAEEFRCYLLRYRVRLSGPAGWIPPFALTVQAMQAALAAIQGGGE